jgi:hypothetical protein
VRGAKYIQHPFGFSLGRTTFTVSKYNMTTSSDVAKPVSSVQIDALVILQIIQHCRDFHPVNVTGQLLGLDDDNGVLQVSHSFPFPHHTENDSGENDDGGID